MAVGLLGTAVSGLQAFQRSISVAGHNISNANTEGYTRQRVELGTRPPSFSGQGYIGNGVQIEGVERLFNQFAVDRLRETSSSTSQYETLFQFSERVTNMLGDADAGLSAGLESFFDAVQTVADDPASISARQQLLSESDSLVARFQHLDSQLDSIGAEINGNLGNVVTEINDLSSAIADTNKNIADAAGQSSGEKPNDLLDKRDQLINRLSELVSVRTVEQDDGALNVFVGSGQSLVTGFLVSPLQTVQNDFDPSRTEIGIASGGATAVITDNLTGGQLGAILGFRDQVLTPAQNSLGRIATSLAVDFNQQHRLGMDLDNAIGGDYFTVGSPLAAASVANTGGATVSASFDTANIDALTTEDYTLGFDGAVWTLKRVSDDQAVAMSGTGAPADPFVADGLNIFVSAGALPGDRFRIQPTRTGSASTGLLVNNAREIAAASPLRVSEASNANGLPTNLGNAAFELQAVDSSFAPLTGGITFSYDAVGQQYNYAGDAVGSFAYDPATDRGASFTVAGISFTVTGAPADGDGFVFNGNANGSSDNGNALLLAGLQTAQTMEKGTSNFQGAYGQLIGQLGTQTRSAQITAEIQGALLAQAQQSRDEISGVNLDEEAANLLRFQQAYQAIAQVISVADSTFQTLINALGR